MLAFNAVATQEIRVPVSLVAHLLSTQSNSGRQSVARLAIGIRRKYESGDSAQFGSGERKKKNVDAENQIFDDAVACADDTSSLLVCYDVVGKRAKRLVSRHKHLLSSLHPSQVNC